MIEITSRFYQKEVYKEISGLYADEKGNILQYCPTF